MNKLRIVQFLICGQFTENPLLSITKDQELQQPDFSIAICSVRAQTRAHTPIRVLRQRNLLNCECLFLQAHPI